MALAPPFTSEAARLNGIKSGEARRERAKQLQALSALTTDEARVRKQIDKILGWMEREKDKDEYVRLAAVLERLWNLVLPKAGSRRPGRSENRRAPPVAMEAPETPQAPPAGPVNPSA